RPLARPIAEDAVEHVERLAHLLRVRVRAEVPDPGPVPLAREHDARELVLHGHRDVRERLVVAQADVEGRPVALDEVLLEVERLDLGAGDDHLDVGDARWELADLDAPVGRLLEVGADARAQRLRLAHVQHLAARVAEQVDARLGRERRQLRLNTILHPPGYGNWRMSGWIGRALAVLAAALAFAPAAHAGGPSLVIGATE